MKNLIIIITLPLLVALTSTLIPAQEQVNFEINGWQIHEYNIPKVEEAILNAHEYGVNTIIFSHALYRHTEAFLAGDENFNEVKAMADPYMSRYFRTRDSNHSKPSRFFQSDIKGLGKLCKENGLNYYVWTHELDGIPAEFKKEGKVDMDNPKLYDHLKERYQRLFTILPDASGMVLTFHETEYKVFRDEDVFTSMAISERIYKVSKLLHDVLKEKNKTLIIRNFFYENYELDAFEEALKRLPDDIIVMNKPVPHEFHPFYPPDPFHGNVGRKRQLIEIDLGIEKALGKDGIYAQTEFIQRNVRRAKEKGMAGMVGRCRLYYVKPFEDSHEVNLYAFSQFMSNPGLSEEEVLNKWALKRYPYAPQAANYLSSAFKRTQFINHNGRYFLEWWLTKSLGAEWGDYPYYLGHIHSRTRFKWTNDPADEKLEYSLIFPDDEIFDQLVYEKERVIEAVEESIKDLKKANRWLMPEDAKALDEGFSILLDAVLLQKEWTRAFFGMRLYMQHPEEQYEIIVRDALTKMQHREMIPTITYGLDTSTGRRYNIDKFVLEMEWRMANRERAIEEDKRILIKSGYSGL